MPKPIQNDTYLVIYTHHPNPAVKIVGNYNCEIKAIEKCNERPGSKVVKVIYKNNKWKNIK